MYRSLFLKKVLKKILQAGRVCVISAPVKRFTSLGGTPARVRQSRLPVQPWKLRIEARSRSIVIGATMQPTSAGCAREAGLLISFISAPDQAEAQRRIEIRGMH